MTLRDMTPDELELFEEGIVQGSDEPAPPTREDTSELAREEDSDRDGLPDGPAERRVPS